MNISGKKNIFNGKESEICGLSPEAEQKSVKNFFLPVFNDMLMYSQTCLKIWQVISRHVHEANKRNLMLFSYNKITSYNDALGFQGLYFSIVCNPVSL